MKVNDFLKVVPDNYLEIAINEYKGVEHTGRRHVIRPHLKGMTDTPEDFLNAEITCIIPYYDRITVEIEAKEV